MPISIGKSVNWVERIDSANTQNPVIGIPADAINVKLTDSNGDIAKFHEVSQQQVDATTDPVVETPEDALHDNANTIYVLPVEPVQSISFVTKAPYTVESETITDNLYQKQVKVAQDSALHYTYVLSFSSIPEDLVSQGVEFKLYWMVDGKRTDVTNDQAYSVKFVDTNDNGINDQIQWTVPHLSEQNFVVQGIINATNAAHLDSNRNIISDVYEQVQSRDGIFTGEISAGDYIRVTFERELTSQNDISIYAKSSNPGATIEVYAKDSDSLIATFDEISNDTMYRILLTNLPASQDTFDLKVIGGSVDFDNIIDPSSTATQLTISASSAATAGTASGDFTVQRQDVYGNPSTSDTTTVDLSSSSATGVFRDSTDTNTITSITINPGSSSGTFKYKDNTAGTFTITNSATGLTSATTSFTVNAGSATQLTITAPSAATAGTASGDFTVVTKDVYGNAATSGATITLSSSSATGVFRNSADSSTITSVAIASGSSSGTFKYKDNTAGTFTITNSATGLTSATTSFTVNPATVSKLVFTAGGAQTLNAGTASSAITMQRQDSYNNPINSGAISVSLSSGSSAGKFDTTTSGAGAFSPGITAITIPDGSSTTTFYYKDTASGSQTLTASYGSLTPATTSFTVNAGSATQLAITAPAAATAGTASGDFTVQRKDADRKSTRLNSSHTDISRMPSSA